jgi:hypothetical protein
LKPVKLQPNTNIDMFIYHVMRVYIDHESLRSFK